MKIDKHNLLDVLSKLKCEIIGKSLAIKNDPIETAIIEDIIIGSPNNEIFLIWEYRGIGFQNNLDSMQKLNPEIFNLLKMDI